MSDRILITGMAFQARHGVGPRDKATARRFEVDVEGLLDLEPAGLEDDLARTVAFGRVRETVATIVESTTFNLIEALAEAIGHELLVEFPALDEVVVRVRRPERRVGSSAVAGAPSSQAAVEIRRRRRR